MTGFFCPKLLCYCMNSWHVHDLRWTCQSLSDEGRIILLFFWLIGTYGKLFPHPHIACHFVRPKKELYRPGPFVAQVKSLRVYFVSYMPFHHCFHLISFF